MPIHQYSCPQCGAEVERLVKSSERDQQLCEQLEEDGLPCQGGGYLERVEISGAAFKIDGRYQTKAIMSDGTKVKGAFGTSEKKRKLGWM